MFDKLAICNTALIRTGNNPAQFEGDGSDEWLSASDAFDTFLPVVLYHHNWGFAESITTLARKGASPHADYTDDYYKPASALHVSQVWVDGIPVSYEIINNSIVLNAGSGTVTAKFVQTPTPDQWPPHFVEALRMFVMSACYRGLNEDPREADNLYQQATAMLQQAQTRSDQEMPGRAFTNSRLLRARSTRRTGGIGQSFAG